MKMKSRRRIDRDRAARQSRARPDRANVLDGDDATDASIEDVVDLVVARRLLGYDA